MKKRYQYLLIAMFVCMVSALLYGSTLTAQAASNPTAADSKKTLYVGYQNYQVALKNITSATTVTYKSSNSKIATVSAKGVVKPVKAGSATITVTMKQGNKTYQSKIAVKVMNPYLSIQHNTTSITKGKTVTFTAKTYGLKNPKIVWSSSDTSIASIDASTGVLKAKAGGKVVITAKDTVSNKTKTITVEISYTMSQMKSLGFETKSVTEADGTKGIRLISYTGTKKNLVVPYGITSINGALFKNSDLTAIRLQDSIVTLDRNDSLFSNCKSLTKIVFPANVTYLPSSVASNCTALTSITWPKKLEGIGESAFAGCTAIKKITLPNKTEYIMSGAFENCRALTQVILPDSVTELEDYVFDGCYNLTNVTLPAKLSEISDGLFAYCTSLKTITLPDTIERIGTMAFDGCSSLSSITLPANLTEIGDMAFSYTLCLQDIETKNVTGTIEVGDKVYDHSGINVANGITVTRLYAQGKQICLGETDIEDAKLVLTRLAEIGISDSDSDLEKIRKVHDWMVRKISPNYDKYHDPQDEGRSKIDVVLNDYFAVCDGYSNIFWQFMRALDIDCIITGSSEMFHDWNMVRLDDDCWYHIDVTWDDPADSDSDTWSTGYLKYKNLLLDDDGIRATGHHDFETEGDPAANGTKYLNYFDHSYSVKLN